MKWLLALPIVVGCSPAAADPEQTANKPSMPIESRERRPTGADLLTAAEVDFLLDDGTGHDYAKLSTAKKKHLCMTIQQVVKASTPQDIYDYLNSIYDGSEPTVMDQKIAEMAAAGVTLMQIEDDKRK